MSTDPGKARRGMVILQREEQDLADVPRARADSDLFAAIASGSNGGRASTNAGAHHCLTTLASESQHPDAQTLMLSACTSVSIYRKALIHNLIDSAVGEWESDCPFRPKANQSPSPSVRPIPAISRRSYGSFIERSDVGCTGNRPFDWKA